MSTRPESRLSPALPFVELPNQREKVVFGRVQMGSQRCDAIAELFNGVGVAQILLRSLDEGNGRVGHEKCPI